MCWIAYSVLNQRAPGRERWGGCQELLARQGGIMQSALIRELAGRQNLGRTMVPM